MFKYVIDQNQKKKLIIYFEKKLSYIILFILRMLLSFYFGLINSFFSSFSSGLLKYKIVEENSIKEQIDMSGGKKNLINLTLFFLAFFSFRAQVYAFGFSHL